MHTTRSVRFSKFTVLFPSHSMSKSLFSSLSMTFGRPSMIPENYLRLELPAITLQVVGQARQPTATTQKDGMFYAATL